MKKRLLTLMLAAVALVPVVKAQSLWTSAELEKKFTKKLGVYVEAEYRTHDGMSSTERWAGTVGLDYKICSHLKMSAGYTYIHQHTETEVTKKLNIIPPYWQSKHRGVFALTGSYNFGNFEFSLRERYQCTYRGEKYVPKYDEDGDPKDDELVKEEYKHVLRSRLGVEFKKKGCAFTPYVQAELYNLLSESFGKDQIRYTVGTSYKVNKKNSVSLFYRYVDEEGDEGLHVIGVGYKFKL